MAERPEHELNPLLRRADWRFLLGMPRPRRAFCRADGPLARALEAVADEVATGQPRGDCDLAVADSPGPATVGELFAALRPGGACYTEWPRRGDPRRIERALTAAGFTAVACYRPWPAAAALPACWLPTDAPGAERYQRARSRLPGGRLRRLAAAMGSRIPGLGSGEAGRMCAIARRPGGSEVLGAGPAEWCRAGWAAWGLGPPPDRLSLLLLTGGPRAVSKAVLLVFAEPAGEPRIALKAPRVPAAVPGVRREAAVLAALGAGRDGPPGIPRLLFEREAGGVPVIGESVITGRPLESLLTPRSFRSLSLEVTDWLAVLAGRRAALPASAWREALVEPALARFEREFGAVADPGMLRDGAAIARAIGDWPAVPEQRDFGPWNLLVTREGGLGVLDWESAVLEGLPALDLLYYLAYAGFQRDGAHRREARVLSYRRSLDPSTGIGAVRAECLARYLDALGLDAAGLAPLRVLLWLVHAPSEYRHAAADAGGPPTPDALRRSLFLALWEEEVRRVGG